MNLKNKLITLLLACGMAFGQNPNTAVYPGGVATDTDLLVFSNRASTFTSSAVGIGDVNIPVSSTSLFIVPTVITIQNEIIKVCTKTASSFGVCSGGRGFNSTSAAAHASGISVTGNVVAYWGNQINAEIIAIEANAMLNPLTTLGDVLYGGASGVPTRLGGQTTATKKFLTQTGDGSASAAPGWNVILAADVPTLNQNTLGNAATATALATTPTCTSCSNIKTITSIDDHGNLTPVAIQLAAADGSTLGLAAFAASDFNAATGVISLDYTNGQAASGSAKGFLIAADWTTFNNKQAAGNYITALTGEVTASGPGSVAATIAARAVTYAKMQAMATAKLLGRNTASSGDIEELGTIPSAVQDNITRVGTVTSGTWSASTIALNKGGTGQTTQQAAYDALAPTATRAGDITYWDGSHYVTLAGNNSGTKVLQETSSGVPSWATAGGGGATTTVGACGSRPGSGTNTGDVYICNDSQISYVWSGAAWTGQFQNRTVTPPVTGSLTALNSVSGSQVTNGHLVITQTGAGSHNLVGYAVAKPGVSYTVIVHMTSDGNAANFNGYGFFFRDSAGGGIITFGVAYVNGVFISVDNYNSFSSFNGNALRSGALGAPGHDLWLKVTDNLTTRTYFWSMNGYAWTQLGTGTSTTFITPNQVGFFLDAYNTTTPQLLTVEDFEVF